MTFCIQYVHKYMQGIAEEVLIADHAAPHAIFRITSCSCNHQMQLQSPAAAAVCCYTYYIVEQPHTYIHTRLKCVVFIVPLHFNIQVAMDLCKFLSLETVHYKGLSCRVSYNTLYPLYPIPYTLYPIHTLYPISPIPYPLYTLYPIPYALHVQN